MKMAKKFGLTHTRTQGPKNHKPVRIMRGPNGQFISSKPPHERRQKKAKVPRYDKYIRDLSNPNAPPPTSSASYLLDVALAVDGVELAAIAAVDELLSSRRISADSARGECAE